jgi:hypothetical protein
MGIEPTLSAWKAEVLPLNYARLFNKFDLSFLEWRGKDSNLRRRKPADLQSAPVGHLGTPPRSGNTSRLEPGASHAPDPNEQS